MHHPKSQKQWQDTEENKNEERSGYKNNHFKWFSQPEHHNKARVDDPKHHRPATLAGISNTIRPSGDHDEGMTTKIVVQFTTFIIDQNSKSQKQRSPAPHISS